MRWQKCPICDGQGIVSTNGCSNSTTLTCPTCKGKRIIDELSGLPPMFIETTEIIIKEEIDV